MLVPNTERPTARRAVVDVREGDEILLLTTKLWVTLVGDLSARNRATKIVVLCDNKELIRSRVYEASEKQPASKADWVGMHSTSVRFGAIAMHVRLTTTQFGLV